MCWKNETYSYFIYRIQIGFNDESANMNVYSVKTGTYKPQPIHKWLAVFLRDVALCSNRHYPSFSRSCYGVRVSPGKVSPVRCAELPSSCPQPHSWSLGGSAEPLSPPLCYQSCNILSVLRPLINCLIVTGNLSLNGKICFIRDSGKQ